MGLLSWLFGPPSREKFVQEILDALKAAGDTREAIYDPDEFQIRFHDSTDASPDGVASLHNCYLEYSDLPAVSRKKYVSHVARAMLSHLKKPPEEFDDARHDLLPIVRSRSYFEMLRLQQLVEGREPARFPSQDIAGQFVAALVYDLPESMRSIGEEELDEWGVTYYEAMEHAILNLEQKEFAFAPVSDGLYASVNADNYDASRLLLIDRIRELPLNGAPVAMVPNRDMLLITGADDLEGLTNMVQLAEHALDGPRPLVAVPMILDRDGWADWNPGSDHPLIERFRFLEVKSLFGHYADQKQLLEALAEKTQSAVAIADYEAVQKESDELVNYCIWRRGVEAMLPKTHVVLFVDEDDQVVAGAEWSRVEQIVGGLMTEEPETYPPRYCVRDFPSEAQLRDLGQPPA